MRDSCRVKAAGFVGLLLSVSLATAQEAQVDSSWLGQKPAGEHPEQFAPGIASTQLHEHACPSFSPDGREVLWNSVFIDNYTYEFPSLISSARSVDGRWSTPGFSELSRLSGSGEAAFSPDGRTVFFSAPGPPGDGEEKGKLDIWVVHKTDQGWGEPENLGAPINTPNHEGQPSVTSAGTLYYKGYWEGGKNNYGIYRSRRRGAWVADGSVAPGRSRLSAALRPG